MVGIVIVSHSKELANAIVNYTKIMAANANVASAGGMEDGGFGTSYEKIKSAIDSVYSDDGVIVLMDLGSAVMTTEMVIEEYDNNKIVMVDCPIVEGAIVASVDAPSERTLDDIIKDLEDSKSIPKF